MSVWAILAAAGKGDRLGLDRPKAFAPLNDRPLVAEPLERLEASDWIEGIVVAAPPEWEEPCILVAEEVAAGKVAATVTGGEPQRVGAGSARRGARGGDGRARPRRRAPARHRRGDRAGDHGPGRRWDGAVPALPIADAVKRVEGEAVVETLDRGLVIVQTPQAFVSSVLREALVGDVSQAADCASLVEARGGRVRVVEGDPHLLKVTDPADLELVASWL